MKSKSEPRLKTVSFTRNVHLEQAVELRVPQYTIVDSLSDTEIDDLIREHGKQWADTGACPTDANEYAVNETYDEVCVDCGAGLGEGYNGLCGSCADFAAAEDYSNDSDDSDEW